MKTEQSFYGQCSSLFQWRMADFAPSSVCSSWNSIFRVINSGCLQIYMQSLHIHHLHGFKKKKKKFPHTAVHLRHRPEVCLQGHCMFFTFISVGICLSLRCTAAAFTSLGSLFFAVDISDRVTDVTRFQTTLLTIDLKKAALFHVKESYFWEYIVYKTRFVWFLDFHSYFILEKLQVYA